MVQAKPESKNDELTRRAYDWGIDCPTKERLERDDFEFRQLEKNGGKVVVNTGATAFHKAHRGGKLTDKQLASAEWFEKAYGYIYGGEVPGRRDPLDLSPRGGVNFTADPTAYYLHVKDLLAKVEARIKLETLDEQAIRERALKASRKGVHGLLTVGKWGNQRYMVVRSVCAHGGPIGDMRPDRRRYQLLCQGLDIITDVVF